MTEQTLITTEPLALMPVMDLALAKARRQALIDFTRQIMEADRDYGVIPGTGGKPTLYKPGAEKLCNFFGLSPSFDTVDSDLDWTGERHGNEPLFFYQSRCTLKYGDRVVGQGIGSCNSWEKKYRYRNAERICPNCGEAAIIKGKEEFGGGWLCWNKKGGCGTKWADGAAAIEGQTVGKVPNDNPADLVNTIDKMAQKRALVAAVLIAVNASEFFTQDIEDMSDIINGSWEPAPPPEPAPKHTNGNGIKTSTPADVMAEVNDIEWKHVEGGILVDDEVEPEPEVDRFAAALEATNLKTFAEHAWQALDGYNSQQHIVGALVNKYPADHGLEKFVYGKTKNGEYLQWLADRKAEEA